MPASKPAPGWGVRPSKKSVVPEAALDEFVNGGATTPRQAPAKEAKEPMRRLNVEIPARLHKRLSMHCAGYELSIRDVVIKLLEEHVPN